MRCRSCDLVTPVASPPCQLRPGGSTCAASRSSSPGGLRAHGSPPTGSGSPPRAHGRAGSPVARVLAPYLLPGIVPSLFSQKEVRTKLGLVQFLVCLRVGLSVAGGSVRSRCGGWALHGVRAALGRPRRTSGVGVARKPAGRPTDGIGRCLLQLGL